MAQQVRHELELFADTHDTFHFETVFFRKAHKALLCPECLVVDIENTKRMFALVRLKITEISRDNNLEEVFDANKIRQRHKNMAIWIQMFLAEID